MATRSIIIRFTSRGVQQTATEINKVADAVDRLAISFKNLDKTKGSFRAFVALGSHLNAMTKNMDALAKSMARVATYSSRLRGVSSISRVMQTSINPTKMLGNAISNAGQSLARFSHYVSRWADRSLVSFISRLRDAAGAIQNFGSVLRMVGQALQNFGITMTFFVSAPLSALFKEAASDAITFDDALVRVKKTTDLTWESVGRLTNALDLLSSTARERAAQSLDSISASMDTLSGRLIEMAKYTPTPLNDLALLAEEAGRLGVAVGKSGDEAIDAIMGFVQAANMIGVTTDINAEDAIRTFGRLANATGLLRDEMGNLRVDAGDNLMRLASVVNELENTTMGSARNITDAMERMIASAGQFDIPAQSIAAFAATLYELGFTSETAGTMFERMTTYMAVNVDKLSEAAGVSIEELRRQMDTDMVQALMNVVRGFSDIESSSEAAALATEIFGVRAERAVATLGQAYGRLQDNLETANKEFVSGTSLVTEYFQALDSTQNQLQILKNNLSVASVMLGKTFLPTLNRVVQIGIALVQMFVEAWEKLTPEMKLVRLAIVGVAIVIPPLAVLFGSLLFVVGMLVAGLGTLAVGLVRMGNFMIGGAIPAIMAMAAAFLLMPDSIAKALDAINGVLDNLQQDAKGWGSNIVRQLADGMISGIRAVVNAARRVAEAIAQFFRGFSPPRVGPLQDIYLWGINLMTTLLEGFTAADFSFLETAAGYIEGFFRAFGIGEDDINVFNRAVLQARNRIKELINIFNRTGEISREVLSDISGLFGDFGQHVAQFLTLQLQYNREVSRQIELEEMLDNLRQRRDDVEQTYRDEVAAIAATGGPAAERVRSFREARDARDDELAVVDEEISAAEHSLDLQRDVVDAISDQLELQQALLDTMMEEARMARQIEEDSRDAAGSAGDLSDELGGIDWGGIGDGSGALEEFNKWLEELTFGVDTYKQKIDEARLAVLLFWAALTGGEMPEGVTNIAQQLIDTYGPEGAERINQMFEPELRVDLDEAGFGTQLWQNAYDLGIMIRDVYIEVSGIFSDINESLGGITGPIEEMQDNIANMDAGPLQGVVDALSGMNPLALIAFATIGLRAATMLGSLGQAAGFLITLLGGAVQGGGAVAGFAGGLLGIESGAAGAGAAVSGIGLGPLLLLLGAAAITAMTVADNFEDYKDQVADLVDLYINGEQPAAAFAKHLEDVNAEAQEVEPSKFENLAASWERLQESLSEFGTVIAPVIDFLKTVADKTISAGIDATADAIFALSDALAGMMDIGSSVLDFFSGILSGGPDVSVGLEGKRLEDVAGMPPASTEAQIGAWNEWLGEIFGNIFETVIDYAYEDWPKMMDNLKLLHPFGFLVWGIDKIREQLGHEGPGLIETVFGFFHDLYMRLIGRSLIPEMVDEIVAEILSIPGRVVGALEEMYADAKYWFEEMRVTAVRKIVALWLSVRSKFNTLRTDLETRAKGIWEDVTGWFKDIYDDVTGKIGDLIDEALRLFNDWKDNKLDTFFSELKTKFETTFETIKTTISGLLKGGLNIMLDNAERAINGIIDGINSIGNLIMRLPGASALLGGIFPIPPVDLPSLASGGIVMSPITAIVGDTPGGEAVVPLRRLPSLITDSYEEIGPRQVIHIRIDRVDARDKEDIDALADRISRELGRRAKVGSRLGVGVTMG